MSKDLSDRGPFVITTAVPEGPIHSMDAYRVGDEYKPVLIYGAAIDAVAGDANGRLWAFCGDEPQATQIDYCPFTGRPARWPINQGVREEQEDALARALAGHLQGRTHSTTDELARDVARFVLQRYANPRPYVGPNGEA